MSIDLHDPPRRQSPRKKTDTKTTLTEIDVAQICVNDWLGRRVFDHRSAAWFSYDRKGLWRADQTEQTLFDAQRICREAGPRFEELKRIKAVVSLARSNPSLAITSETFDKDRYLLGTPEGIVDLRTGLMISPDPHHYITKSTKVAPDFSSRTPIWDAFMMQVTGGDRGIERLLQQWFGLSLTGDTREQKLLFIYGRGRNGKGVFMRQMAGILGDYAHRAQPETFTKGLNRHPTELASMVGKRLVYCSETESGNTWAEAKIKDITGGDKLTARFMRQDEFEFQPEFKLVISGNYAPQIESADEAMRNRFLVVPFDQVFSGTKADQRLDAKLEAEWPGILAWAIAGCRDWQDNGLVIPEKVRAATDVYFQDQDIFKQWLDDETTAAPTLSDTNIRLMQSWATYAKEHGEPVGTSRQFAERMRRNGATGPHVTSKDGKSFRVFRGFKALMQ